MKLIYNCRMYLKKLRINRQKVLNSAILSNFWEESAYKWPKQQPYKCIDEHFSKINNHNNMNI